MSYDPLDYWEQRGADYHDPPPHLEDGHELPGLAGWVRQAAPETVLEVGSGWGRIYLFLRESGLTFERFAMCDIAESMRRGCQARTGLLPDRWDGKRLPYPDAAFDLVLSFSVLLHVPSTDLEACFAEHVRVTCGRLLVTSCTAAQKPLAAHCFLHDYVALFRRCKVTIERTSSFVGRGWERTHWLLQRETRN